MGALRSSRPGLRQLQQGQRGHGLADAADLERRFGERRAPRRQVGIPDAGGEKRLPPVGHGDGQARGRRGRKPPLTGIRSAASEVLRNVEGSLGRP